MGCIRAQIIRADYADVALIEETSRSTVIRHSGARWGRKREWGRREVRNDERKERETRNAGSRGSIISAQNKHLHSRNAFD
jgi:hypothetical protein